MVLGDTWEDCWCLVLGSGGWVGGAEGWLIWPQLSVTTMDEKISTNEFNFYGQTLPLGEREGEREHFNG